MRAAPDSVNGLGTITRMNLISGFMRHTKQRGEERDRALTLYVTAVEQARRPGFYTICGVADTLDGRFDLIVLHVHLVVRNLRPTGEPGKRLTDLIFKIMMDDMDMNLREMGVGDLSVGKRVKAMARAFYGRSAAYDAALDGDQADQAGTDGNAADAADAGATDADAAEQSLEIVLKRNIYGAEEPEAAQIACLTTYLRAAEAALKAEAGEELVKGAVTFFPAPGEPDGPAGGETASNSAD